MKYNKKMLSYSASAIALLAIKSSAGQVVYTNIDPDAFFEGDGSGVAASGTLNLDMDANGATDIQITVNDFYSYGGSAYAASAVFASVHRMNNNFEMLGNSLGWTLCCHPYQYWEGTASNLAAGAAIGPAQLWIDYVDALLYVSNYMIGTSWPGTYTWRFGNWGDDVVNSHYIGIRKQSGANYQYGWIRLSTTHASKIDGDLGTSHYTITIHDFAFNNTINDPVTAGEGLPGCNPPVLIGAGPILSAGAKLLWNAVDFADKYQLSYRPVSGGPWQKKTVSGTSKNITGLTCNTEYEWKVRSKCGVEFSDYSETLTFTTASCRLEGEQDENNLITVSPNPASDILFIESNKGFQNAQFKILDVTGNTLKIVTPGNTELIRFDISDLSSGVYFLVISNESVNKTIKFIRQ